MKKRKRRYLAVALVALAGLLVVLAVPAVSPRLTVRFRLPSLAVEEGGYDTVPLAYDLFSTGSVKVACDEPGALQSEGPFELSIEIHYLHWGRSAGQKYYASAQAVDSLCEMTFVDWPWSKPDSPNAHYLVLLNFSLGDKRVATHTLTIYVT